MGEKRPDVLDAWGRRLAVPFLAVCVLFCGSACSDDKPSAQRCDPADANSCGPGERCSEEGYCEEVAACDPADPTTCPGGYVCRPSESGPVCEPELSAGRIPSCIDSDGIDVFAVEANGSLSVTWNVNATLDHTGGFRVSYGTASDLYDDSVSVSTDVREATLKPLDNGTVYYVAVDALDSGGGVTFTSCEIFATPHVLVFLDDQIVNASTAGDQQSPDLASNLEGTRLYLVWEDDGVIKLSISTDFGDSWSAEKVVATGSGQAEPAIAVRDQVLDEEGTVVVPETALIAWQQGGRVYLARYLPETDSFETALDVAAGSNPDVAVGPSAIHLAFGDNGTIYHAGSNDDGVSFLTPLAVSGATTMAHAASVAVNEFTGDVYVAWDAIEGGGDSNIYFSSSEDEGASFGAVVRVDDDAQGQNQLNVSIAVDERSQKIYATWEDRRGGANVYFTWSEDWGATWETNIDVGAGFNGDQFRPQAVVDAARNVYVGFQDTTDGQRPIFTRFNSEGSFDPPLAPSAEAGSGGIVGDNPTVATDRYGAVYVAWEENRGGPTTDIFFARAE